MTQSNDLYRIEIRKLRTGAAPASIRPASYGHVIELRKRYVLLSIPLAQWME